MTPRYFGAHWMPTGPSRSGTNTHRAFVHHEAVTTAGVQNIWGWSKTAKACHGYTAKDGDCGQFVEFDQIVAGTLDGNGYAITWETWDDLLPATGRSPDGSHGPNDFPWTEQQVERQADIAAWAVAALGIPLHFMTDTRQPGHAPHRLGVPSPTGRVNVGYGPDCWTKSAGKSPLGVGTMIPTPNGLIPLLDIRVGDVVYDQHGQPCNVLDTIDYPHSRAYQLAFDDGTEIIASADHLWSVVGKNQLQLRSQHRVQVNLVRRSTTLTYRADADWATWNPPMTTEQLAQSAAYSYAVPLAQPVAGTENLLPVDPYLLGLWLGDGGARDGVMCAGHQDVEWMEGAFIAGGYVTGMRSVRAHALNWRPLGLERKLRLLGVLGNKHVPSCYLTASRSQREALLAGLMDSDGGGDKRGNRVEFTNKNEQLANSVHYLAASLGQKPRTAKGVATLYGVEHGPKYRVSWRATEQCFRLPRKAAQITPDSGTLRSNTRSLVSAIEVPAQEMRCIRVDSPENLFLVTASFIATHNCPGDLRIIQLRDRVLPRAAVILAGVRAGRFGWLPPGPVNLPAALSRGGATSTVKPTAPITEELFTVGQFEAIMSRLDALDAKIFNRTRGSQSILDELWYSADSVILPKMQADHSALWEKTAQAADISAEVRDRLAAIDAAIGALGDSR